MSETKTLWPKQEGQFDMQCKRSHTAAACSQCQDAWFGWRMGSGQRTSRSPRHGFTIIELMVVITIIAFLVLMSITMIANMLSKAKEAATMGTIQKIDGLLQQRMEAFEREFQRKLRSKELNPVLSRMAVSLQAAPFNIAVSNIEDPAVVALARKELFLQNFPQLNRDSTKFPPIDPMTMAQLISVENDITESSENLHWFLTEADVFGVPPISDTDFGTSEVKDTDGDGLLEFVDAWGNPLRFYRWPTRLFKPWGQWGQDGQAGVASSDDDNNMTDDDVTETGWPGSDDVTDLIIGRGVASLLIAGLPSLPPAGELDPLNADPDDPLSNLTHTAKPKRFHFIQPGSSYVQNRDWMAQVFVNVAGSNRYYGTIDTYYAPLIVSAGPDEILGLEEPTNTANFGFLAAPRGLFDGMGNPVVPIDPDVINEISDNITNRNKRAGG